MHIQFTFKYVCLVLFQIWQRLKPKTIILSRICLDEHINFLRCGWQMLIHKDRVCCCLILKINLVLSSIKVCVIIFDIMRWCFILYESECLRMFSVIILANFRLWLLIKSLINIFLLILFFSGFNTRVYRPRCLICTLGGIKITNILFIIV